MFKLSCCKVNYRVASLTLLLLIVFPVGVTFSQTREKSSVLLGSGELIAQAQTKKQRQEESMRLNKQGLQLQGQGKYKEALELFEKALVICKEIGEKEGEAVTFNNIGRVYDDLGQYQKALDYFQQSLVISQQIGEKEGEAVTFNNIGGVYLNLGQYQKALDFYQQSLVISQQIGNKSAEGTTLNGIGRVYDNLGQYQKALDFYQQSLVISQQIGNKSGEGTTLNNIGGVYHSLGQYQKASYFYQQSLVISQQIGDKSGESRTLSNIGLVYNNLGQYQKALDFYQQSLAIRKHLGDKSGEGTTLHNIGLVYDNLGQYQKALDFYQQSLAIRKHLGDKSGEGTTLHNIGLVYDNLGQYQKALDFYQQSLIISQQIGDKSGEGTTLNNIGGIYRRWRQYQKALDYSQQALVIRQQINDKAGEGVTLNNMGLVYFYLRQYQKALDYYQQSLVIRKQIRDKAGEGDTLNNIGAVYVAQSQYSQAEKPLFAAIEIWDYLRTKLSDYQKISLFAQQTDTYKFLQLALIPQNKISLALEISERGRARAFIDLLTSKATNNNDAIAKLPTIADIKQIAQKQKSTLVEYSVLEDKLYIWIVKPTGEIAFEQVDLESLKTPLNKLVEDSRVSIGVRGRATAQISRKPGVDYKERLQQLHNLLIKPIAKHLPKNPDDRVVFIPHESLFLVPFPALMDENQKYLIEKHTILTAPAIQVLEFTEKTNPTPIKFASLSQDEKLIVGNPIMPFVRVTQKKSDTEKEFPPKQLPDLPGAENETRLIASLLNAKPLIGKEATKTAVMQRMNNAKLIHFATHGLLDGFGERTPGAIALSPDSPPSPKNANEGLLRTSEIVENLKLQADLIILSACDTGKGEITGDGVLGLSRALLTAGAKSLIVSLWKVPDNETSDLMVEFYQQLEKNPDKARALRQAMLKTKEKHPGAAYWAAFTIIGNPE